ncbi:MAG: hypothetical protein JW809_07145 [Pirellulales bacterium]|nr:hypothetical protein [Pirellulales bacterium]
MPANETPPDNPSPENAAEVPAPARLSLWGKLKLLALVGFVVLAECTIGTLWLPQVSESQAKAAAGVEETEDMGTESLAAEETAPQVEVDLGEFTVTAFQPSSSTTMRIDFHLYGMIAQSDEKELLTLKEENDARMREQVNAIVRAANISDVTDPGLGLIKRRILEKTNQILGKPLLKGVIFSDFSYIEQ